MGQAFRVQIVRLNTGNFDSLFPVRRNEFQVIVIAIDRRKIASQRHFLSGRGVAEIFPPDVSDPEQLIEIEACGVSPDFDPGGPRGVIVEFERNSDKGLFAF